MLSYLQLIDHFYGPLRLFQFISVRSVLAGLIALVFGFLIGPSLIRILQKIGAKQAFRDKSEVGDLADLHESKSKTPTMGGLLIFGSVVISSIICAELNIYVVTALTVFAILTGVGFLDDYLKVTQNKTAKV